MRGTLNRDVADGVTSVPGRALASVIVCANLLSSSTENGADAAGVATSTVPANASATALVAVMNFRVALRWVTVGPIPVVWAGEIGNQDRENKESYDLACLDPVVTPGEQRGSIETGCRVPPSPRASKACVKRESGVKLSTPRLPNFQSPLQKPCIPPNHC